MSQYRRTHRERINSYSRQKMREYRSDNRVHVAIGGRIVETTKRAYNEWYQKKFQLV
jgi:ribosomal protein L21E